MKIDINKITPFFPKAFIYKDNELIIEPKNNIFFRIDNVNSDLELDCKMIEYLSRSACKGLSDYWQRFMRRGLNSWFKQNWSVDDLKLIYTYLGCGADRSLCIQFIESSFDLLLLKEK